MAAAVASVWPAAVSNDQPRRLSVRGVGLAGASLAVADRELEDVHLDAAGALTGTLPPGLCPGTYPVAASLPGGGRAVGGSLAVSGARSVVVDPPAAGPVIALTGRTQVLTMTLPAIRVTDTTCGDTWRLALDLELRHADPRRPARLAPVALRLAGPTDSSSTRTELVGAAGRATASLNVPHARELVGATLVPILEIRVPASAAAGNYLPHLEVAFAQRP